MVKPAIPTGKDVFRIQDFLNDRSKKRDPPGPNLSRMTKRRKKEDEYDEEYDDELVESRKTVTNAINSYVNKMTGKTQGKNEGNTIKKKAKRKTRKSEGKEITNKASEIVRDMGITEEGEGRINAIDYVIGDVNIARMFLAMTPDRRKLLLKRKFNVSFDDRNIQTNVAEWEGSRFPTNAETAVKIICDMGIDDEAFLDFYEFLKQDSIAKVFVNFKPFRRKNYLGMLFDAIFPDVPETIIID